MARFINSAQIYVETVTIAAAGAAQNATSATVPEGQTVIFEAHPSNTGYIKISDTAVKAQAAVGEGNIPLTGGQAVSYQINNASVPFIDATVTGDRCIVSMEF